MARAGRRQGTGRRRRALTTVVVAGACLAAAVLAGPRLVPGDRLAARAAEALAAASGARVSVADASVTLVGGPGLRLREVRLDALPAWEATLESAGISLAVAPLVRGRLVVDRVLLAGTRASTVSGGRPASLAAFELDVTGLKLAVNGPDGLATAPVTAGPGPRLPAGLAGRFVLRAGGAALAELELADVSLAGSLASGRLALESLAAGCGGGRLAGAASLETGPAPRAWEATLRLDGVDAATVLAPWTPEVARQLAASLTGEVRAGGTSGAPGGSVDGPDPLASLTAEAHLGAGEGLVRAGPWLAGAEPYLGDRQDLVDIRLANARVAARLEGGRCLVDTLRLRGPDTDWDLAGSIGLPRAAEPGGEVDLAVHVRLPAGFTPRLGAMTFFAEAMRDAEARVNLDLAVRGPLAEPTVNLDLAAMSRRVKKP